MADYNIAIIGSGPAGLSAAARAAVIDKNNGESSPTYILLEGYSMLAQTIQRYQKGKKVMAEPGFLDLRSDINFQEGIREDILDGWEADQLNLSVNIRYSSEVKSISGEKGNFEIGIADGAQITAENIVLGIGLQGNPRTLGCEGERLSLVQYHLDDPQAFNDEVIIVVGAGDSAIENALALSENNDVYILNRKNEFSRAKEGNLNLILKANSDVKHRLNCLYSTSVKSVSEQSDGKPLKAILKTETGEKELQCDRIIARLGAIPPRKFVESIGIEFPSDRQDAIPELSRYYESNVEGVYIVGSLAGCPLIKQAMNQGYDVVEFIHGNHIKPADYPLLQYQLAGLPFKLEADELLDRFQRVIPMFRAFNSLQFREFFIESNLVASYPKGEVYNETKKMIDGLRSSLNKAGKNPRTTRIVQEGSYIYKPGEFGASFFTILEGSVTLEAEYEGEPIRSKLSRGEFFGESSLLSGRPRSEAAIAGENCVFVETPRRTILKLINSNEEVKSGIDWIFIVRELQRQFVPYTPARELKDIGNRVKIERFDVGSTVYKEGEEGASLFIIRSGAVSMTRTIDGVEVLVSQLRAGDLFGELSLMGDSSRRENATATVALEVIRVEQAEFLELTQRNDMRLEQIRNDVSSGVIEKAKLSLKPEAGGLYSFLMNNGMGEATNVLIIDERLCVGCDNCEKACAETHMGISRLDRKLGPTAVDIHIPTSCRHCAQPHCMKDCPPNAILRAPSGEVFIDDSCIGCGNCKNNCPYGVIRMSYPAPKKPGLFSWIMFGSGSGPGEQRDFVPDKADKARGAKAAKCDACVDLDGGPACVRSCPTGAAKRINPAEFVDLVEGRLR